MIITSFFPGRVRLRAPVFKNDELCEKAKRILSKSDSVKKIEHNPLTGSILLEYDVKKVPMENLLPMQDFFMKLGKEAERYDGTEAGHKKIVSMLDELESIITKW